MNSDIVVFVEPPKSNHHASTGTHTLSPTIGASGAPRLRERHNTHDNTPQKYDKYLSHSTPRAVRCRLYGCIHSLQTPSCCCCCSHSALPLSISATLRICSSGGGTANAAITPSCQASQFALLPGSILIVPLAAVAMINV